jgi:Zn-dependent peptidase ImmA (M78 family)
VQSKNIGYYSERGQAHPARRQLQRMISIKQQVESLCKRYDSRDPFEIARQKKILVLFEPLGTIRGYYNHCYRQKFIHINEEVPREEQLFICAHELGHAILHPNANTPFLVSNTFFCVNKLEIEANRFAADLICPDEKIRELSGYTISEMAACLGLEEDLVRYKCSFLP